VPVVPPEVLPVDRMIVPWFCTPIAAAFAGRVSRLT